MGIYEPMDIFSKRIEAERKGEDLIYKCFSCKSDINLNSYNSPNTFRGSNSFREFLISGLCQKCQDSVFKKEDDKK